MPAATLTPIFPTAPESALPLKDAVFVVLMLAMPIGIEPVIVPVRSIFSIPISPLTVPSAVPSYVFSS